MGVHGVQHAGILSSLAESYDCTTSEGCYYDTLSKNLDANLAEADMESFRTEDIHALLTTLPAMCAAVPAPGARDAFASVTGSMLAKFDFLASSVASSSAGSLLLRGDHSSGAADDSSSRADASPDTMSICKSELLFSPVKETPMPGASFSVDSLDCDLDHDLMLTCQATNKDNYTIAFEGSIITTCSGDGSEPPDVAAMARSDSGLTTWSELRAAPLKRHPSGNNNSGTAAADERAAPDDAPAAKSHSMPNLHNNELEPLQAQPGCVKLFDIQNQASPAPPPPPPPLSPPPPAAATNVSGSYYSEMAVSVDASSEHAAAGQQQRFNLVKLFMRQRSASADGVGPMDRSSASEGCWPGSRDSDDSGCGRIREEPGLDDQASERSASVEQLSESPPCSMYASSTNNNGCVGTLQNVVSRSMQTSALSARAPPVRVVPPSFLATLRQQQLQQPVYVVYPNYTLPDLAFLTEKRASDVHLVPQTAPKRRPPAPPAARARRPFSCNDVESLKRRGFAHVRDWDSLTVLLPAECRQVLADVPELEGVFADKPPEAPQFCAAPQSQPGARRPRPASCDCGALADRYTASSSSSTATQPSSGYRGSSTMLSTDSSQTGAPPHAGLNPLLVYRYDSVTSSEAASVFAAGDKHRPPVPRRSVSLTGQERQPPRPPLPRGILRAATADPKARKNLANTKRHSRASQHDLDDDDDDELDEAEEDEDEEDEGVEAGHATDSSLDERFERAKGRPPTPPLPRTRPKLDASSCDELEQLEEYLKSSAGFSSCSDGDDWDEADLPRLRSQVARFLALKINRAGGRKSVSFAPPPTPTALVLDTAIREEESISPPAPAPSPTADVSHKMALVSAVTRSVERLVQHFSAAMDRSQLKALGDSERTPACARLVLSTLCPALYTLLGDGLKPSLDTPFGPIGNSVWQVVETTAQQGGPLTGALGDLVARVNAQDVSAEGLVKFNAFVCGLLNVRSLDAWAAFVRTRETALRRHYAPGALLLLAHTPAARSLLDALVAALRPLALLPFRLDLLYESRELHRSFRRIADSRHLLRVATDNDDDDDEETSAATMVQRCSPAGTGSSSERSLPDLLSSAAQRGDERPRPRSCVADHVAPPADLAATVLKRWSGVHLGSKFVQAFDRLADDTEEEYTDSLEPQRARAPPVADAEEETEPESDPVSLDSQPLNGGKFRRLQRKWEMLSGKEHSPPQQTCSPPPPHQHQQQHSPPPSPGHTSAQRSRIPRPVASSPVKSAIPVPLSPSSSKPVGGARPPAGAAVKKPAAVKSAMPRKAAATHSTRASRVDLVDGAEGRAHPVRPSSLPYRPASASAKAAQLTPPRRAVSSSVTRNKPQPAHAKQQHKKPKYTIVRTLSHRLPSDNGHLSYNEGERLQVILEVDNRWLLCCRGDRKGLVPRSAVIEVNDVGPSYTVR